MTYFLNYHIDTAGPHARVTWLAARRMIYVWTGSVEIEGTMLKAGAAIFAEADATAVAGVQGAVLFRWDLVDSTAAAGALSAVNAVGSMLRMSRELWSVDIADGSSWLFRLDWVNNPPAMIADVHTHEGPGIRALLTGSFRCRQPSEDGTAERPGDPWWETGVEAVISTPHATEVSSFLRCMLLPTSFLGRPSGIWHRRRMAPPDGWPIWNILVDRIVTL